MEGRERRDAEPKVVGAHIRGVDAEGEAGLLMPRSTVLDAFVRAARARAVREGNADFSPLHPPDPSVVPAPVYKPLQLRTWSSFR